MTEETEQDKIERVYGFRPDTVGDIIEGSDERPMPPRPFVLPRLEGYPHEFPEPGLYFDMPEDFYHAIPAVSCGGIKTMAASPMLYWALCRWMNAEYDEIKREQEEKREKEGADHFDVGHAYHARILEGRDAFRERFVIGLDRKDYPNAVKTEKEIQAKMPEGLVAKGKTVADKFADLQRFVPDAQFWPDLEARHARANPGKTFITAKVYRQLEIAAAMIEKDDELSKLVTGGYPEVSMFWHCPKTGLPKKLRCDYLKIRAMVDLKSYVNQKGLSAENAINQAIANNRYVLQPSHYLEGAAEVRKILRERGADAVHVFCFDGEDPDQVERVEKIEAWSLKWAAHTVPDEWFWLFQQKGIAPIARGVNFPRLGTTKMLADDICSMMAKRIRLFADTFGCDPWIDSAPIYDLADEDLPRYATEI